MEEEDINIMNIMDVIKGAGDIILKYYKKDLKKTLKSDSTVVTKADIEADIYLHSALHKLFPEDKILSEESKDIVKDYSGRVWIVDPLDGTNYFADGKKGFAVILGLCENGVPVLGIIYAPLHQTIYYAQKNKGAFMENDSGKFKLRVSNNKVLSSARRIIKKSYKSRKLSKVEKIYEAGISLKIMEIAKGNFDYHIDESHIAASKWDVCGPQIILEEAGGKLTGLDGTFIDYKAKESTLSKSFMASNGILHDAILRSINKIKK